MSVPARLIGVGTTQRFWIIWILVAGNDRFYVAKMIVWMKRQRTKCSFFLWIADYLLL